MICAVECFSWVTEDPPTVDLFSKASKILFIRLYEAVSIDGLFLKPYSSCVKILLLLILLHNLFKITFSNILENDVSKDIGL